MALLHTTARCVLFLLLAGSVACRSTTGDNRKAIGVAHLREDFQILRKTLEEAHPGLYQYSSKSVMNACFDSTYGLLKQDLTDVEFFKLLLPVIAQIRCVHTSINFSEQTRDRSFIVQKGLPLRLYFNQGKVYIRESLADSSQAGLEILAINHVPIHKLVTQFLRVLPTDGYNETFKYYLLEHGVFREAYALYMGQPDAFVIDAFDPTAGKPVQFTIKAKSQQELNKLATAKRKSRPANDIDLAFRNNAQTAILTLNTFEIRSEKFSDTIRTIFKTIQQNKTRHLIIDLRNNGGGNNRNVPELFSYVAEKPFFHLKRAEMITQHFTYLQHTNNPTDFQNLRGTPTADGTYLMNYLYPGTSLKNPAKGLLFNGNVTILTSGATVSAASEFVALARANHRALMIGEETGGCYYGATGGRYLNLILPNSQLQVSIPTIRIFTAVPEDFSHQPKGRGVLPDVNLKPTINQLLTRRDSQLEAALSRFPPN